MREKLPHFLYEAQSFIETAPKNKHVVSTFLDDLQSAEVPVEHYMELHNSKPIYQSVRKVEPSRDDFGRQDLWKMPDTGFITRPSSALSFPVVVVEKKDVNPRFCVDGRMFNSRMKAHRKPCQE